MIEHDQPQPNQEKLDIMFPDGFDPMEKIIELEGRDLTQDWHFIHDSVHDVLLPREQRNFVFHAVSNLRTTIYRAEQALKEE